MMDVTMTDDRYGRTTQCTNGELSHRVSSTGAPQPEEDLDNVMMTLYVWMVVHCHGTSKIPCMRGMYRQTGR